MTTKINLDKLFEKLLAVGKELIDYYYDRQPKITIQQAAPKPFDMTEETPRDPSRPS